ncbi:MMPL family transporter [Streptomyces sp. NPDC001828]|uniref:MMPL family transporter n=1 Tax=Streptomyces sp. NPDC001828 TaxID=3364615 RepID=UPI0036BC145F
MKDQPLTLKVASWSALHPGRAIAGWFVFVALCLALGAAAGTRQMDAEDHRVGESGRAESIAAEGGLQPEPTERIAITDRTGSAPDAAAVSAAEDIARRMRGLPGVERVAAPVRSSDGSTLMLEVTLHEGQLASPSEPLQRVTAESRAARPGLRIEEVGDDSAGNGVDGPRDDVLSGSTSSAFDLSAPGGIALPLAVAVVFAGFLAFGSPLMLGVPLLLAASSVAAALGLSRLVSHVVPDAGVASGAILLTGVALGVAHTLFHLRREREERALADGRLNPEALVGIAAATSGRAIAVSGLAVAVSMATLFLAGGPVASALAAAAIVVSLVAVAGSMTLLPALLVVLGRRPDRRTPAAPGLDRRQLNRHSPEGIWGLLVRPAKARPTATLLLSVPVMLGLSLPAFGAHLRIPPMSGHPRTTPEAAAHDRLTEAFPELLAEHRVAVRENDPGERAEVRSTLNAVAARAGADPARSKIPPTVRTTPDGRISVLTLPVPYRPDSPQAQASLADLRENVLPATLGKIEGAEFATGGPVAGRTDQLGSEKAELPVMAGSLLLLTFATTLCAFGSAAIALLGALLNLLSAGASFGLTTAFFQQGVAAPLLGSGTTGPTDAIDSHVPLFLCAILFVLSTNYQVFVVSRIREAILKGVPARQAVADGLGHSARAVGGAALVTAPVFASLLLLRPDGLKQLGFGLAAAILLDGFVVRALILPSALALLGDAAWWPSRAARRARRGPAPAPAAEAPYPYHPAADSYG